MDPFFSSSSGDVFDSAGFNDFMNASDSSEENLAMRRPKPVFDSKQPYRPNTGDIYGFDIDFGNIKIPTKEPPKPKTAPKSALKKKKNPLKKKGVHFNARADSPEDDDRPHGLESYKAESKSNFLKALEEMRGEDSSISESSEHQKIVRWDEESLEASKHEESVEAPEIKTEPFRFGAKPPISLNKKLDTPTQKIPSPSSEEPPISSSPRFKSDEDSNLYTEEFEDIEEESKEDKSVDRTSEMNVSLSNKPQTPQVMMTAEESGVNPEYVPQPVREPYSEIERPINTPIEPPRLVQPTSEFLNRDLFSRGISKPDERIVTRERQLEIELVDLRRKNKELEDILEIKQEQIYQLEKKDLHENFAKIEGEAFEKMKIQLREANHQIELYKIETEELIKQVDYTEARVKDMEMQNNTLLLELKNKEKTFEERLRASESRTSERTMREMNRKTEYEKEDLLLRISELQLQVTQVEQELARSDAERKELRQKLFSRRDEEEKVKSLEHQLYSMSSSKPNTAEAGGEINNSLQKEIESQEIIIKGYQKENEKLVDELRNLKLQMREEQLKLEEEVRKVDLLKGTLIKDHGGILIRENISDIEGINELVGGTVINREEYFMMKERSAKLDRDIIEVERAAAEREIELEEQIDSLRRAKLESESKIRELPLQETLTEPVKKVSFAEPEKGESKENMGELEQPSKVPSENFEEEKEMMQKKIIALEQALEAKENEYEQKLEKLRAEIPVEKPAKRPRTSQPSRLNQSVTNLRVQELEKQVEDTKNYYIKRINDLKKTQNQEEVSELREKISFLESKQKVEPVSVPIFAFISSGIGSIWVSVCQELSKIQSFIKSQDKQSLIKTLNTLTSILDSHSQNRKFHSLAAFNQILDKITLISSSLGNPIWQKLLNTYYEIANIVDSEVQRLTSVGPENTEQEEEEYWSDFSDDDYSTETKENESSTEAISYLKQHFSDISRQFIGLQPVSKILNTLKSLPIEFSTMESFVRRLPRKSGKIDCDEIKNNLNKPISWWREELANQAWESRNKISTEGNFQSLATRQDLLWILPLLKEKLEIYSENDIQRLAEEIFCTPSLTKRRFRQRILELRLPLNREDCHILTKTLDEENKGVVEEGKFLSWFENRPKVAWNPPSEVKPTNEEYNQLSERDAQFMLLQAQKRIKELESKDPSTNTFSTDHTLNLKVKTLEEENKLLKNKLDHSCSELEKLKLDRMTLQSHLERSNFTPGASEFLILQAKLEALEQSHYRRESDIRNKIESMGEEELENERKRHEFEKMSLQKELAGKSRQLEEFKKELDELLMEIDRLRSLKNK